MVERATGSGGAITRQSDYKYDVFNNRISKSVDADGAGGGSAAVTRYVYDGNRLAFTLDGASNVTGRYVYGPAVDQILASEDASGAVWVPLADNLGTVRDILNSSGSVQNHITFSTFGNIISETNAAIDFIMGYAGSFYDGETGLNYHGGTYVDGTNGQLASPSPLFGPTYAGNSPSNYTMPAGGLAQANPYSYLWGPYDPIALGLVHPAPVASIPPYPSNGNQGFVLTAGGLGSAAEWLGIPEAQSIQNAASHGVGQVNVIPQPTVNHNMSTSQQFVHQIVGTADSVMPAALATHPVGLIQPLIPSVSTVINTVVPGTIDTSNVNYGVGNHLIGPIAAFLAEEAIICAAIARAARASRATRAAPSHPPTPPAAPEASSAGRVSSGGAGETDLHRIGSCFVAGTPVLMSPHVVGSDVAAPDAEDADLPVAWTVALAGLGLAALAVDNRVRRRRLRESEGSGAQYKSMDAPGESTEHALELADSARDWLFAEHAGVAEMFRDGTLTADSPAGVESIKSGKHQLTATAVPSAPPRDFVVPRPSRGRIPWLRATAVVFLAASVLLGLFTFRAPRETPVSATPVAAKLNSAPEATFQAIETIQVGQRVLGENPTGEFDDSLGREVDPVTWRKLTLRAPKGDGTFADVVLLRPIWWIEERAAFVGGTCLISVPECGIDGNAEVLAIEPCPPIPTGPGNVVIGTFYHQSAQALDLYIEGQDDPIGTTANHPFWSVDRRSFVRADSLRLGETLRGFHGPGQVINVRPLAAAEPVFNIEVLGRHVYYVGGSSFLVHNKGGGVIRPYYPPNNGFVGQPERIVLPVGTRVDRYGDGRGTFASPVGTPASARSLPPGREMDPITTYEVIQPIQVDAGHTAPWFDQLGWGYQYDFWLSFDTLVQMEYLRVVVPGG